MTSLYDIVVIGSGPAGCMAAIGAKKQKPSASVCIVDNNGTGIRHRIGEALLTGTMMTMARAGLDKELCSQRFHKKIGAAYLWGKNKTKPWYVNYPKDLKAENGYSKYFMNGVERWTLHVPRHKFDEFLLSSAKDLGVIHINSNINDLIIEEDFVKVGITDFGKHIFGRRWIDCSGQSALISKKIGVREKIRSPRAVNYAYVDDINWDRANSFGFNINRTNIISNKNGWMWVIHIGNAGVLCKNSITSIGFVMHPKKAKSLTMLNIDDEFPELNKFFGKSNHNFLDFTGENDLKKWYKCPHFSYVSKKMHGENWSVAGDSAGFIDPILSQGVTLATHYGFERGISAASALDGVSYDQQITEDYYTEIALLNEVCEMWYDNKLSSRDWKLGVQKIGDKFFDKFVEDPETAFRLFTNLEHVRSDLSSFSKEQMDKMASELYA